MSNKIKLAVVGGDIRYITVAEELASQGYEVAVFGQGSAKLTFSTRAYSLSDALGGAVAVVLPITFSTDKTYVNCPNSTTKISVIDLFYTAEEGCLFIGGRFDSSAKVLAMQKKITLEDYAEDDCLAIANAVPTAEGAIAIAMNELPITIYKSKCAVLGYGRCGKVLASALKGLGAIVTVVARKPSDRAYAEVAGFYVSDFEHLPKTLRGQNVIFNTVPEVVIRKETLAALTSDTLIIDLASAPGGVDLDAAAKENIKVIQALSLPGKVAPVSAGKIIAKTVSDILKKYEISKI